MRRMPFFISGTLKFNRKPKRHPPRRKYESGVDRLDALDGFHFYEHALLHKEVGPVDDPERPAPVQRMNGCLAGMGQPALREFDLQRRHVGRLQQARSERLVNDNGRIDHLRADLVIIHPISLVSSCLGGEKDRR
jgi:hypothetical protein